MDDVDTLSVPVRSSVLGDDVDLEVRRWVGPGRHRFLLVHGLASNARLWDEVAAALAAAGHSAYAVDLRSHGESDAPPGGYDSATAAADLAAVVGELGIAPAVVAGQSWGGNVVVRYAAEQPAQVAALALVDGGWIDLAAEFASWQECAAALRPPDLSGLHVDDLRQGIRDRHPDWSGSAIDATVANLRVDEAGRVSRRLSLERHMAIVRSMWDDPPARYYGALTMPTLLMPALPTASARAAAIRARVTAAAAAMPRAMISEYAGADHDVHAHRPHEVAKDLLRLADEAAR